MFSSEIIDKEAKPDADLRLEDVLARENDELKQEIAELKRELDELQDSFRTKDAEEFQRIQMELELSNKKCRVMQYRLLRLERKNEELNEEKQKLEDCLSYAKGNALKVEELEDELAVAKEVSVRLHKELEDTEESRALFERLNNQLREQFNAFKEGHLDSNQPSCKLSDELHNALSREYELTRKVGELERQIRVLQSRCHDESRNRQSQIDCDQKLIMLHSYVCRLRDTIDQKDQLIESLQNKCGSMATKIDTNSDGMGGVTVHEGHFKQECSSFSSPDLSIVTELTNGGQMRNNGQQWQCVDASTQYNLPGCTRSVYCRLSEQAESALEDKAQQEELSELRSTLRKYLQIKEELQDSLREATELMLGKDQEIEFLRNEKHRLDEELAQFQRNLEKGIKAASHKHAELIEGLRRENEQLRQNFDSMSDELRNSRQEQFKSEQERVRQLQELRGLEQNYRELGERLNNEVCQLNKQINQLNEDKERLESNLQKLKGQRARQQPVSRLLVNSAQTTVGAGKHNIERRKKPVVNGVQQSTESKVSEPPEIRVKLQQHNVCRNSEVRASEQTARSAKARPTSGRVQTIAEESKQLTRAKPPRMQQDSSRQVRKLPRVKQEKRNESHQVDSSAETTSRTTNSSHNSIATKAQSLISRIRYRSSSRSAHSGSTDKARRDSKLPKPAINNVANGLDAKQRASDVDSNTATMLQSSFIGECSVPADVKCAETSFLMAKSPLQRVQSFSEDQMDTLINRVTSTARPLMMNSLEKDN